MDFVDNVGYWLHNSSWSRLIVRVVQIKTFTLDSNTKNEFISLRVSCVSLAEYPNGIPFLCSCTFFDSVNISPKEKELVRSHRLQGSDTGAAVGYRKLSSQRSTISLHVVMNIPTDSTARGVTFPFNPIPLSFPYMLEIKNISMYI